MPKSKKSEDECQRWAELLLCGLQLTRENPWLLALILPIILTYLRVFLFPSENQQIATVDRPPIFTRPPELHVVPPQPAPSIDQGNEPVAERIGERNVVDVEIFIKSHTETIFASPSPASNPGPVKGSKPSPNNPPAETDVATEVNTPPSDHTSEAPSIQSHPVASPPPQTAAPETDTLPKGPRVKKFGPRLRSNTPSAASSAGATVSPPVQTVAPPLLPSKLPKPKGK